MEKIKELRDRTGAGMVDCKKALDEAAGDIDKAIEMLRKKGIAKAAKRSERDAGEGVIAIAVNGDNTKACAVELNSETDFVARNEQFQDLVQKIADLALENNIQSSEELKNLSMGDLNVEDSVSNLSGVIGEKLVLGRFALLEDKTVAAYSHMGGKIAVLVGLDSEGDNELASDIAMHVAAANPRYLNSDEVPAEEIEKEKSVYREQLIKEGKPEAMIDSIMEGKIKKYYSEVCLLNQEYIKDDKQTISQLLGDKKLSKFVRFSL